MSLVRPEAAARLARWREALSGGALLVLGAWSLTGPGRARLVFGVLLVALGALFVLWGVQRARFRSVSAGEGIVEVDEAQITYFGPEFGGSLALDDLVRVAVVPPHSWELSDRMGQRLTIPVGAAGADALFEALVALPGFRAGRLAGAAQSPPAQRDVIWQRADTHTG